MLFLALCCFGVVSSSKQQPVEEFLQGTVWFWNNWRDIKFNKDGSFFAPEDNCQHNDCSWSVTGNKITIDWRSAGLHHVELSHDKKFISGRRYDGDQCSGTFKSKDAENAGGATDPNSDDYDPYAILGVEVSQYFCFL